MDSTCPRKRWAEDAHPEVRDLHRDLATLKTWCTPPTQAACLLDGVDQPSPFEEPTSHRSDRRHPGGAAAIGQAQFLDHPFGILTSSEPGFRMESKPIPGVRAGSCTGCTTRHAENVGSQSSFAPRTDHAVRLTPLASQVRYKTPPTVAAQVIAVTMHDAERHGYPMGHEEGAARARSPTDHARIAYLGPLPAVSIHWGLHRSSMPYAAVSPQQQDCAVFATSARVRNHQRGGSARKFANWPIFAEHVIWLLFRDLQQFPGCALKDEPASIVGRSTKLGE